MFMLLTVTWVDFFLGTYDILFSFPEVQFDPHVSFDPWDTWCFKIFVARSSGISKHFTFIDLSTRNSKWTPNLSPKRTAAFITDFLLPICTERQWWPWQDNTARTICFTTCFHDMSVDDYMPWLHHIEWIYSRWSSLLEIGGNRSIPRQSRRPRGEFACVELNVFAWIRPAVQRIFTGR